MDMSIEQFRAWAKSAQLSESTEYCAGECIDRHDGYDDDNEPTTATVTYGWIERTLSGVLPDGAPVEITYQVNVEWAGTERERYDDEFTVERGDGIEPIILKNIRLCDDDGDALGLHETADIMIEVFGGRLTDIDAEPLIPAVQCHQIDEEGELMEGMEQITLSNPGAPDVRFIGKLVAQVSSSPDQASSYYSGSTGRYTILRLFRTRGGKLVAEQTGRTQWQGERDRIKVAVCDDEKAVIEFFGHGWLAKDLYEEAGISDVTEIE